MSQGPTDDGEQAGPGERDHVADAPDGCGCAEMWEHLSESRDGGSDATAE